jgi:hypothetical protein
MGRKHRFYNFSLDNGYDFCFYDMQYFDEDTCLQLKHDGVLSARRKYDMFYEQVRFAYGWGDLEGYYGDKRHMRIIQCFENKLYLPNESLSLDDFYNENKADFFTIGFILATCGSSYGFVDVPYHLVLDLMKKVDSEHEVCSMMLYNQNKAKELTDEYMTYVMLTD